MTADRGRCRLLVRGVVQGVGFRPFVYSTAAELALTGSVANDSAGVIIDIEGAVAALDEFTDRVRHRPPPLAAIESVERTELPVRGGTGFRIAGTTRGGGRTLASPDVAICADCARELTDPTDRRYRHPFINCTNCGPRFTIIASLPYDRDRTSMADFAMCERCATEYRNPADRRFHAQPIACPDCGPTLNYSDPGTTDPLAAARKALREGAIVAVKGIGGYHLACAANHEGAVATLRSRKRRGDKPFAVMVPDLDTARTIARIDADAVAALSGPQRPIVLLPRGARPLAPSVAPGNRDVGVLLAYTPLHLLLFGLPGDPPGPDVLVMTSANLGGEPICYRDDDAAHRLAELADEILGHDRRILVPCDDSVIRLVDGTELPIRRSRGYAPLPVSLPMPIAPAVAVGADVKNTCAVADGRYAWLSQHIGDMDDLATLRAFEVAERHLEELTGVRPERLATDAHPGYRSSAWAQRSAAGRPVYPVQHHHAHIAAVMGEHGLPDTATVTGIAFDGTGFGADGAIWGGEVLAVGYKGFRRLAHLAYVPLPGGDASVHRPYRMALAHLFAAGIEWSPAIAPVAACPPAERRVLRHQLETGMGCVPTSSMGRLFDAVAALAGVRQVVDYEAQAAIELEGRSRDVDPGPAYRFTITNPDAEGVSHIDPVPVLAAVVADSAAGVSADLIGARFHAAVALLIVDVAHRFGEPDVPVALSGGVFQNALLLSLARKQLQEEGFHVITHRRVPPNDGGLALGQLLAAGAR
jgi:hydrogenase maturation protein HypF